MLPNKRNSMETQESQPARESPYTDNSRAGD